MAWWMRCDGQIINMAHVRRIFIKLSSTQFVDQPDQYDLVAELDTKKVVLQTGPKDEVETALTKLAQAINKIHGS